MWAVGWGSWLCSSRVDRSANDTLDLTSGLENEAEPLNYSRFVILSSFDSNFWDFGGVLATES